MQHGFIKVAAASPAVTVADPAANAERIIEACRTAAEAGVKLIVFPELSVTGYTCGDLFLQKTLLDAAERELSRIAMETAEFDMLIAVGAPIRWEKKLYDCAVMLYQGMILGAAPKSVLANFCEADELRRFTPAPKLCGSVTIGGMYVPFGGNLLFTCESLPDLCIAFEIGAELWAAEPVSAKRAMAGATIICGLAATSETVGKAAYRRTLVASQSARTMSAYIYADAGCGESTTDLVFSGHDMIYENGAMLAESKPFENFDGCPMIITEIDVEKLTAERRRNNMFPIIEPTAGEYYNISFDMTPVETELTRVFEKKPFVPENASDLTERCEAILDMQSHGLKKRISHARAKTAVIGISGGLDSCLALLVAVRAMDLLHRPRTDVIAVTMPCFGTTVRTRTNAEELCERLGVTFRCIDIKAAVNQHFADIGHDESNRNVVYENVQARERTQVIMDIANAENGMVIGTGDLSELALGWATYNGDHMSMYGVNASIPKTLIRHIVRTYADTCGDAALSAVLIDILATPVSPELLPAAENGDIAQKTEDLVGPYELHDFYLYWFLRHGFTPEKIERMALHVFAGIYSPETISKWLKTFLRRFIIQQFKRSCLPDGVKVGSAAISPRGDLRIPSDASFAAWLE